MDHGIAPGGIINLNGDLLHRQVPASWMDGGRPCEHAFRPRPSDDDDGLSVYWGRLINAKDSYVLHIANKCQSASVYSLSVGECQMVDLPVYFEPIENNPTHSLINFKGVPTTKSSRKAKSIMLREYALSRGATHLPGGSDTPVEQEKATA